MKTSIRPITRIRAQQGFTLIELMISLLIGLIVVAAAGGMFLSNSRVYGSTESVGRIQESTRAAFEILSRDIREAGGTPCSGMGGITGPAAIADAFRAGLGVSGSTLQLYLANANVADVVSHSQPDGVMELSSASGYVAGQAVVACNAEVVAAVPVGTVGGSEITPSAAVQNSAGGGYCFLRPTGGTWASACAGRGSANAFVARLARHQWRVADNGRGSRSLFLDVDYPLAGGGFSTATTSEVAEGVSDMALAFRRRNDTAFQTNYAGWGTADWQEVVAVQVTLEVQAVEGAQQGQNIQGTDGQALRRQVVTTTALRNREGVL